MSGIPRHVRFGDRAHSCNKGCQWKRLPADRGSECLPGAGSMAQTSARRRRKRNDPPKSPAAPSRFNVPGSGKECRLPGRRRRHRRPYLCHCRWLLRWHWRSKPRGARCPGRHFPGGFITLISICPEAFNGLEQEDEVVEQIEHIVVAAFPVDREIHGDRKIGGSGVVGVGPRERAWKVFVPLPLGEPVVSVYWMPPTVTEPFPPSGWSCTPLAKSSHCSPFRKVRTFAIPELPGSTIP